jgi:hypothetical protein
MSREAIQFSMRDSGDVASDDDKLATNANLAIPGTKADASDMRRMGKEQELNVCHYSLDFIENMLICRSATSTSLPSSDTV